MAEKVEARISIDPILGSDLAVLVLGLQISRMARAFDAACGRGSGTVRSIV